MALVHILIIAILQGVTEFLPVSSSGHLILVPLLTGWQDQGQFVDVALHLGTLGALVIYFSEDILAFSRESITLIMKGKVPSFLLSLIIATLPAVILGMLLKSFVSTYSRSLVVIGCTSIIFGALMYLADRFGKNHRDLSTLKPLSAFLIGLAQACALIPGASRSGATVTMARLLGFTRVESFRFSFLLSIPVILGAGLLSAYDAYQQGVHLLRDELLIAMGVSLVIGYGVLALMMRWMRTMTLAPFACYRIILGTALLLAGWHIL